MNIKNKLIIIQLLTAVVAIMLCGLFFGLSYFNKLKDNEVKHLYFSSKATSEVLSPHLQFYNGMSNKKDNPSASELLENIDNIASGNFATQSRIQSATVFDKDNNAIVKYTKTDQQYFNDYTSEASSKELWHEDKSGYYNMYSKIYLGDSYEGRISIRYKSAADQILQDIFKISAIVLFIGFIVAFGLSTILQKSISEPILKLVSSMRQVSESKNYDIRVAQSGSDEIAELSSGFNEMLSQIKQRDDEVQMARNSLEQRVQERTKELNEKARALEISNKELEQFAYIASHDLQEPLRMIGSFAQLIARRYKGKINGEINDYIDFIVEGVSRMQNLIEDLLLFSRVNTRKTNFQKADFKNIIEKCKSNLRYAIETNEAQISYNAMPHLVIDDLKILQLFQNLVSNAIKFRSDVPPLIHIAAEEQENHWLFAVKDNGIGIEKEYGKKVFMIFQRLHKNTYPGTGIGLSICKRIVELHKGNIWFESEAGQGTTFFFTIDKDMQPAMLEEAANSSSY
ncbi:MAG: ATP-binding protein [Chitinophagales bacterium]